MKLKDFLIILSAVAMGLFIVTSSIYMIIKFKEMKDLTYIQPQQKSKSILDLTPYELAVMDNYQRNNRGFEDDSDEDLENYFNNDNDEY